MPRPRPSLSGEMRTRRIGFVIVSPPPCCSRFRCGPLTRLPVVGRHLPVGRFLRGRPDGWAGLGGRDQFLNDEGRYYSGKRAEDARSWTRGQRPGGRGMEATPVFFFCVFYLFIYLFIFFNFLKNFLFLIFGCVGFSLLRAGFLYLWRVGRGYSSVWCMGLSLRCLFLLHEL